MLPNSKKKLSKSPTALDFRRIQPLTPSTSFIRTPRTEVGDSFPDCDPPPYSASTELLLHRPSLAPRLDQQQDSHPPSETRLRKTRTRARSSSDEPHLSSRTSKFLFTPASTPFISGVDPILHEPKFPATKSASSPLLRSPTYAFTSKPVYSPSSKYSRSTSKMQLDSEDDRDDEDMIYTSWHGSGSRSGSRSGSFGGPMNNSIRNREKAKAISTTPGVLGAGETETEADEPYRHLPTSRIVHSGPIIPPNTLQRSLTPFLFEFFRLLSIVPAIFGTLFNLYNVYHPNAFSIPTVGRNPLQRIDYFVSALWSILTGYQCLCLTTGLLTRWNVYYTPLPTLIRLLALQGICWPATHLTLTILEHDKRPVIVWAIIGTTTSISRSVQIWVTSNLWWERSDSNGKEAGETSSGLLSRLGMSAGDDQAGYWKRWGGGKWGGRRWDWREVWVHCALPAGLVYFVMAWAEALRREWTPSTALEYHACNFQSQVASELVQGQLVAVLSQQLNLRQLQLLARETLIFEEMLTAELKTKIKRDLTLGAGFLSLANEVLLQIFTLLDAQELFALSLLSTRLHHLALPLYFLKQHVEHNSHGHALSLTDDNISALPGFQISFITTSLGSLSCTLRNDGSPSVFRMAHKLFNVMSNLSRIDEVSFKLEGFETNMDPVEWYKIFVALLQMVVDKSCTKLTVQGSELPFHLNDLLHYNSPPCARPSTLRSRVRNGTKKLLPKRKKAKAIKLPTQDRSYSGKLRSFFVHSAMLVLPPFDAWTIKTLNASPTVHLSVETPVARAFSQWPAFLTSLDLHKISSFQTNTPSTSFSDYSHFISQHPSLTICEVTIDDRQLTASHTSSDYLAPSTVMTATGALVPGIFEVISSFPPMKKVTISAHICQDMLEKLDIKILDDALHCVAKLPYPITLVINLSGGCSNWLDPEWSSTRKKRAEYSLKCVTKLQLSIPWMPWNFRETIPGWLGLFPTLESVKLPNIDPREEDELVEFIRSISKANRRIKTLHIQDRERTIQEWLTLGK